MIRRPPRSTLSSSSAASDVYKRQGDQTAGAAGAAWVADLFPQLGQGQAVQGGPAAPTCSSRPAPSARTAGASSPGRSRHQAATAGRAAGSTTTTSAPATS